MASFMGGPCRDTREGMPVPIAGSPTLHGSAHPFGDGEADRETAIGEIPCLSHRFAQSRTVALPFTRLIQDHPHLFQVNPGVDASLALEYASLFLAAAYEYGVRRRAGRSRRYLVGMACLIELAKSVVDSVSGGLIRGEDAQ